MAFIVLWHCRVFRIFGWTLIHPTRAYEKVVEISGIFPVWFYLPFWIAGLFVCGYAVILGFSVAKRNPKSLQKLIICIPVLWIVDSIDLFREDTMNWDQSGAISVGIILVWTMVFMSIPYVPMFFF